MPAESREEVAARLRGMPSDRWQRINDLFDELTELAPEVRSERLRAQTAEDPEVRREVEALLAALDRSTGFLEEPAVAASGSRPESPSLAGERLGAYRILEKIGEGGMAAVYLAERGDVGKRVALKIVAGGLISSAQRQRFLFERRLLARLEHPNIARLLDAGVTGEGVPFFAMEYVDGLPLDRYCDRRRSSVERRLELFQSVCGVVQYAHQNQVVHRDLKPSNILVTDRGEVRLLDFGIAKLLEEHPAEQVLATRTGMALMTPAYASPEQVLGRPVTTASDVYSLGVLLYELLTGHLPSATTPSGRLESVLEGVTPRRPSLAVAELDPTAEASRALLKARGTTREQLRRRLTGDLDAICMKALRSEPGQRYPSADRLLEDVRRHLSGLPVSARHDTAGYLFGKFVRRHRLAVAAACLVVLSMLAGFAATVWQARIAEAERDRARQVAEVLPELFWSLEPGAVPSAAVTPEEMLDRGLVQVESKLAGQPEIQARVLAIACDLYMRLAVYDKAELAGRRAVALARGSSGDGTALAASLAMLAQSLDKQARYTEAEPLHQEALAIRRRALGSAHPEVATSLHNFAMLHQERGDRVEAERLYREALAIRRVAFGGDHRDLAFTQTNLAIVMYELGKLEEAERLGREALAMRRRLLGDVHPDVANGLHNLAAILEARGERQEALTLYRETLGILRKVHGRDHLFVSYPLGRLALILDGEGDHAEAESLLRQALAIQVETHGEDHPDVAQTRSRLGACLGSLGRVEEAETLLRAGYDGLRETYGTGDERTRTARRALIDFYDRSSQAEKAARVRALDE